MTEDEAKSVVTAISAKRFRPFLEESGGDVVVAVRHYYWDGEAARAFLGPLRDLEVAMRNGFHDRLVGRYGIGEWWDCARVRLSHTSHKQVERAKRELLEERPGGFGADDMVAKLMLGFWVGLTGRGINYEMQFWHPALKHVFHGYTGTRGALNQRLDHVRRFRNRIGHHERISHRHLAEDFRTLLELLRHVAPEKATLHEKFSTVPEVLARKAAVLSGAEPVRL